MKTLVLQNEKCAFEIDFENAEISGSDLTDSYNYPKCYNKTSRSIKKAANALQKSWHPEITMYGAMNILTDNGIKMRSYCSMD